MIIHRKEQLFNIILSKLSSLFKNSDDNFVVVKKSRHGTGLFSVSFRFCTNLGSSVRMRFENVSFFWRSALVCPYGTTEAYRFCAAHNVSTCRTDKPRLAKDISEYFAGIKTDRVWIWKNGAWSLNDHAPSFLVYAGLYTAHLISAESLVTSIRSMNCAATIFFSSKLSSEKRAYSSFCRHWSLA